MADRDTLMLLEAIRLEIRAAGVEQKKYGIHEANVLRKRADKLSEIAFSNIQLANDEREALEREQ